MYPHELLSQYDLYQTKWRHNKLNIYILYLVELPDTLPEGCVPIFLATKTQEIFSLRMDEDITSSAPYRLIKKEELLKDVFNRAAVSDFQPFKKIIEVLLGRYDPYC